jgi:uncharacterized protein YndB with AHSA1/START domain
MESFTLTLQLPVTPKVVYEAWIDSSSHRDFTGGNADIDARNGGHYTAWDGYISGILLKLEPYHRIIQSWRTTDFHAMDPSSTVEILLDENENGTLLTLNHTEIPKGLVSSFEDGWKEYYFEPMLGYFTAKAEEMKDHPNS